MTALASFPVPLIVLTAVSTAAVVTARILTHGLRRRSAALRHSLWLLAICSPLLALPFAWMRSGIALQVLPAALQQPSVFHSAAQTALEVPPIALPIPSVSAHPVFPTPLPKRTHFFIGFNPWLALWLLGALLSAIRFIASRVRVERLVMKGCSPASSDLTLLFAEMKQSFDITGHARLWISPQTEIPFCFGVIQPAIVFPARWQQWDEEKVGVCLRHEMGHIVRRDLLAMIAGQWACVLCWFNPLIWFAASKLRDEAEKATDDLVLAWSIRPEFYASVLLAITEAYRGSSGVPAGALSMARPSRLRDRVEAILDPAMPRTPPSFRTLLTVSTFWIVILITALTVRLTAAHALAESGKSLKPMPFDPRELSELWSHVSDAVKSGDIKAFDAFLQRGLDVNVDLGNYDFPLYLAVDNNQAATVKFLLDHGADPSRKTSWGDTPIKRACWRGWKEIADLLIHAGAEQNDLFYAAGMGEVAGLEARDKKQPVTSEDAKGAISFSVASGHQATFDWLWAKLEPLDDKRKNALFADLCKKAGTWGQLKLLLRLEELGADPAKFGGAALQAAAVWNHPDVVKHLLERGISPDTQPSGWSSLLRNAAGHGHLEIVRLLLAHGADINAKDSQAFTPLSWAAHEGQEEVCRVLIEHGADLNIGNYRGENAAWSAAASFYAPGALPSMLDHGARITGDNKRGQTILSAMMNYWPPSAKDGGPRDRSYSESQLHDFNARQRRTVDLLVAAGADVNGREGFETPLMSALRMSHLEAARALMDHGATLEAKDQYGNTPIQYIFQGSDDYPIPVDILETALKHGFDPNAPLFRAGVTPPLPVTLLEESLEFPCRRDASSVTEARQAARLLLRYGAVFPGVPDAGVQTMLKAAVNGDLESMQNSILRGTPINTADGHGWNVLLIASALGYKEAVDWIIAHGADVNRSTDQGLSPLSFAAGKQWADTVDALIAKGAKANPYSISLGEAINSGNQHIFDALIKAGEDAKQVSVFSCIQGGHPAMARVLLEKGADPDPPNPPENRNNVYWAVYYNQPETLQMLLDHGANPSLQDAYGGTALSNATQWHKPMVPILEEAIKRQGAAKPTPQP